MKYLINSTAKSFRQHLLQCFVNVWSVNVLLCLIATDFIPINVSMDGFRFVTSPPQCVERFHRYHSNEKYYS